MTEKVVDLVIRLILITIMGTILYLAWQNGGFQFTVIMSLAILLAESVMDDL